MSEPAGAEDRLTRSGVTYWLGHIPSQSLGVVSCVLLFAMMLLTFIDVGGRYLFSAPLPAAYELISLIMPGIIFCALPYVGHTQTHVTIDLLDGFLGPAVRRWQGVFTNLFSAAALGFISYRLYARSVDHKRFQEVTDELYLPLWPFSITMSVLCAVATLVFIANIYGYFRYGAAYAPKSGERA